MHVIVGAGSGVVMACVVLGVVGFGRFVACVAAMVAGGVA